MKENVAYLPGDISIKVIVSAKCWIRRMHHSDQTKGFLVHARICVRMNAVGYERNKTENN